MKEETVEIDGLKFRIVQAPGRRGTQLMLKITRALVPFGVSVIAAFKEVGSGWKGVQAAAGQLFAQMSDADFEDVIKRLFESVYVVSDGPEGLRQKLVNEVYDATFTGRQSVVLKLAVESVRVNFGDFFPEKMGEFVAKVRAAAKAKLDEQLSNAFRSESETTSSPGASSSSSSQP